MRGEGEGVVIVRGEMCMWLRSERGEGKVRVRYKG